MFHSDNIFNRRVSFLTAISSRASTYDGDVTLGKEDAGHLVDDFAIHFSK